VLIKDNKNIFVVDQGIIFKYSLKSQVYDQNLYYEVTMDNESSQANSINDLNTQVHSQTDQRVFSTSTVSKEVRDFALIKRLAGAKKSKFGV
jgi:hypothetical protein